MERKCLWRGNLLWLVFQLVVTLPVRAGAQIVSCPLSCICVFDEVLHDNSATCTFDNSTVEISWYANRGHITLNFLCEDAIEDFIYSCDGFPQFSFSSSEADLVVTGCAPSVLRCVLHLFSSSSSVMKLDSNEVAGSYSAEDLIGFNRVYRVNMYLRDKDTEMPAVIPNSMPALTDLMISGGNLELSSNLFRESKLDYLSLYSNNIRALPPDTFAGLTKLKFLSIQDNFFEHLGDKALRGLDALEKLIINNNTLASMDPQVFSSTKQLNTLDIINNKLEVVPNGLLDGLNNLNSVGITYNLIEMTLGSHAFANLPPSVNQVDIIGSKVKQLPEHVLNGSASLEQLYFSINQIESLPPKLFDTTTALKYIDLRKNQILSLPERIFSKLNKLQHLDLSENYISTLTGDIFAYNSELKEVNLENNLLTEIDRDVFKGKNLDTLSLASNKLQRIIGNTTLEWQTKKLNLMDNALSVFEDWFVQLQGLEELNLSGNKIKMIKTSHLYYLNSTVTIDLRNNRITAIIRDTAELFVNVTPGDISLYLSNNPLQCDCLVTTLLKEWHKYHILADYEQITCDKAGKLSNLDAYVECNKMHAFVALIGSSVVGALVIVVILITIFTNRWDIWEYVSTLFKRNDSVDNLMKNTDNTTHEMKERVKLYDLFISFAHQDGDLVTDKLLPILENDLKLKVCVHYRDWVVGDLIPVQIKQSVETSTMTMIILTEHFLESEWSNLEFRTAHDLSVEDGKSRVILVLPNESVTRHDKLREELKAYIDTNTYLLWDDTYFWDKLQKILPKYSNSRKKGIF